MKKLSMLCVMMSLFLAGCGKKDADKAQTKASDKKAKSGKLFTSTAHDDQAVYADEANDLFEDSTVADLAFVDDTALEEDDLDLDQDKDGFKVASVDLDDEDMKFEDDTWNDSINIADSDLDEEGDFEEISIDELEAPVQTASIEDEADSFNIDGLEADDKLEEVRFKTVHFDINGNKVQTQEKDLLEENVALAAQAVEEGFDVVIEGHCCQLGPDGYNLALSQQRAESIKTEMVKRGIPAKHIKTLAMGNEAPVVFTNAKDKAQQIKDLAVNRRVEISVS